MCSSLVGGFIWTHPIHVPQLSLLALNIVSLMIVVLGRWSEDVFLVPLLYMRSAEPSVHIQFCPYTCIWKLSILCFLGCLGRWRSQAQRQSWEFWKSSTTKSIRYVNVFVRLPSFASNCYCGSVSTVSCFWDGILPIVILGIFKWVLCSDLQFLPCVVADLSIEWEDWEHQWSVLDITSRRGWHKDSVLCRYFRA
jgi:hypothetical protein